MRIAEVSLGTDLVGKQAIGGELSAAVEGDGPAAGGGAADRGGVSGWARDACPGLA